MIYAVVLNLWVGTLQKDRKIQTFNKRIQERLKHSYL